MAIQSAMDAGQCVMTEPCNERVEIAVVPQAGCDDCESFRNYKDSAYHSRVENHYNLMRSNQTVEFVRKMHAKYSFADGRCRARMSVRQAFDTLQDYVDSSDPDLGLPNSVHALQTAEGVRAAGHPDWMQLVALLHDFGKIMFLWGCEEDGQKGTAEGAQWALGGDTWVVGCRIPDSIVFPEFNASNRDMQHPVYSTECGMYEPGCGMENVLFAYGHDEYMYQMLKANGCALPEEGLKMVRYHSAYAWHDKGNYRHLMAPEDHDTLHWIKQFNKFDLYTKDEGNNIDVDKVWPYYQGLINKYLPGDANGMLRW